MRILLATLLGLGLSTAALADGVDCQTNILSGKSGIKDAATGHSLSILPYAATGETVGGDYGVILTGGDDGYSYSPAPAISLEGTEWVLVELNGQPVQPRNTLSLRAGGEFGGKAACNAYFGQFQQGSGFTISFSQLGSTRAACDGLDEEQAYFSALRQAVEFRPGREGDSLALLNAAGATIALFGRFGTGGPGGSPAVSLEGTEWTLATLRSQPVQGQTTLAFQPAGAMEGMAPCNRYFGSYQQGSGVALTFAGIGSTRRTCPLQPQESDYLQALGQTASFAIGREGDFLALIDAYGNELATFTRPGPGQAGVDVTGRWRVTGVLIDGSIQSGPELAGVAIEFTADGRFSAQLGCNTASGDFASDGRKLSFGAIAVTARQCFAPAPFEGPILDVLPQVRWVQSTGDGIALLDGDRRTLITLGR